MKRRLFIIRHGKSSWESVVGDFDRPLAERGVTNSYEMAGRLEKSGLIPEEIYSSPANRALHTAVIMAKVWNLPDQNFHIDHNLYLPSVDDIARVLFAITEETTSVAVYGHNPGFTEFANHFLTSPIENLPTSGIVVVEMTIDSWTDCMSCKAKTLFVDFPKRAN